MIRTLIASTALALLPLSALADRTEAPEDARVFFIGLESGQTVSNPVTLYFGLEGMGVAPAGAEFSDTGHHHLFINLDPATTDLNEPIPATDQIRHFGGGQTQVTMDLPVGTHTLWLLLGDYAHVPHDPAIMSEPLVITVE